METSGLTLEQIRDGMIEMFGNKLPDIEQEPKRFAYYIKLFFYERFLNEQRNNEVAPQQENTTEGSVREETVENSESTQVPTAEVE